MSAIVRLLPGDCLDVLRTMPDESIHAVVCDPPYGLSNTDPAHVVETLTRWAAGERDYVPTGGGFMGKSWDAFVPPPAIWDECLRVLKPGGHLLAFAGSRTFDLMTLSIRFAGFDIRDGIAWLYGSGFPKSLDVSKAIDKIDAVAERRARALEFTTWMRSTGVDRGAVVAASGAASTANHYFEVTAQPAVATADIFDRIRHLLPEVPERIEELVRQRTVESVNYAARKVVGSKRAGIAVPGERRRSTIGGSRSVEVEITNAHTDDACTWQGWGTALKPGFEPVVVARKPLAGTVAATLLAHGTGALNIDATKTDAGRWPANVVLDEHAATALDEQSGDRPGMASGGKHKDGAAKGMFGAIDGNASHIRGDSGGASRFFYQAKAPTRERPSYEREDGTRVAHPTVKPVDLMRWLVRLVTPPGGTVLDPFAGSGTTIEAALLEGFDVTAIERELDYLPLIAQRIARCTPTPAEDTDQ